MLSIQKYLKSFSLIENGILNLTKAYHIEVKPGILSNCDKVWLYKYDQIHAKPTCSIENDARGLILDQNADIVSMSFRRFFNAYENFSHQEIHWNSAFAEEKHDGTLITMYKHKENTYIQTQKMINAEGRAQMSGVSYEQMVRRFMYDKFDIIPYPFEWENPNLCWVFELVSPLNRIITPYENTNMYLLSIFNKESVSEMSRQEVDAMAIKYGFDRPKAVKVESIEEAVNLANSVKKTDEGYVVVDECFNRIKVKNKAYLAVKRAVNAGSELSLRHFAQIVLDSDAEEISSYFPEYKKLLGIMTQSVKDMRNELSAIWEKTKQIETLKEFAMSDSVRRCSIKYVLFEMYKKKISSIDEGLSNMKPESLVEHAKNRNREEVIQEFDKVRKNKLEENVDWEENTVV